MNWLKRLFGRKKENLKAGPDLIARQSGRKRNRIHLYLQPFGYPILACDWLAVEYSTLEDTLEVERGQGGNAIQILNGQPSKRICRHCLAIAQGRRTTVGQVYDSRAGAK